MTGPNKNLGEVDIDEGPSSILNASPGEVQTKIDNASSAGGGVVRLNSQKTYDPASPWDVKAGVLLDFNGAWVVLSSAIDVLHVHPDGRVWSPLIDATGVDFSGKQAISFRTSLSGAYQPADDTWVAGNGRLVASPSQGTAVFWHETTGASISWVPVELDSIRGFKTQLARRAFDANGYVNTNNARVRLCHDAENFVKHYGSGTVSSNYTRANFQATGTTKSQYVENVGNYNIVEGMFWDETNASGVLFDIGSNAGDFNGVIHHGSLEFGQVSDARTTGGYYFASASEGKGGYYHNDSTAVETQTMFFDLSTSPETLKYKRSDGTVATIA